MMRCVLGIVVLTGTSLLLGTPARGASEIVIAIRYQQAEGTSHSHLYLFREDGKLLRQLTNDNSGQDSAPIFASDGSMIVFTREKSNDAREFWSVDPLGKALKKLEAAPDWYVAVKSSPYFTNVEPEESTSPSPSASPEESLSPTTTPIPTYKSPDGSVELILREDPNDEDDQIDGPAHGKHYLLRDLKTGKETEFGKLPGFYGVFGLLHDNQDKDQHFLFQGPLRLAFFYLHLNSTDGDTVFALDLTGPRLVRLSPNGLLLSRCLARSSFSYIYRESLCSHPREHEDGKLLLHGTLGRKTEQGSLCARKIRRALLRRVDVSARQKSWRDHAAARR